MTRRPEFIVGDMLKAMTDAEVGALVKEYISESNHQGWDGFSRRDMTGIRNFLTDLRIYNESKAG